MPAAAERPRGSLLAFFALTYAMAWILWAAAARFDVPDAARQFLFLPGTFAPAVVAIALTARTNGQSGVATLLGGVFKADVGARWYVFAVAFMAAIKLTAAVILRAATGAWPRFGNEAWFVIVAAIVISTPFQAGE